MGLHGLLWDSFSYFYDDDATLRNVEADVARSQRLMYIAKYNRCAINDRLCINSNQGNCDMNEAGTMERDVGMTEENRPRFHADGEIMANVSSSSDMNSVSAAEVSNVNQSLLYDILLDIIEQQDTADDVTHSCACLPCVCEFQI
jgi:hypothetical protein